MEASSRFVFQWPHGQADQPGVPWTQVAFTLTREAQGTRLSVTESGFDSLPEDRRDAARRGTGISSKRTRDGEVRMEGLRTTRHSASA